MKFEDRCSHEIETLTEASKAQAQKQSEMMATGGGGIAGAFVGAAVAGPVGMVVGGIVGLVGGNVAGFWTGKFDREMARGKHRDTASALVKNIKKRDTLLTQYGKSGNPKDANKVADLTRTITKDAKQMRLMMNNFDDEDRAGMFRDDISNKDVKEVNKNLDEFMDAIDAELKGEKPMTALPKDEVDNLRNSKFGKQITKMRVNAVKAVKAEMAKAKEEQGQDKPANKKPDAKQDSPAQRQEAQAEKKRLEGQIEGNETDISNWNREPKSEDRDAKISRAEAEITRWKRSIKNLA